jgi:hypothetical protein
VSRPLAAALAALLLSSSGCLDIGDAANTRTLDFDFTQSGLATPWTLGVADVPADRVAEVTAEGDERGVPAELSTTAKSLYQSGTNVTGDLFLFQKLYLTGLAPNFTFKISVQVGFVTNYHSGCTTGVGPAVVLKAGVTATEPLAIADAQGVLRMNLDKGAGTAAGDFIQLGDIRNGLLGCPTTGSYALNATSKLKQTVNLTTDELGGLWFFLGTQSSAVGQRHAIYLTQLRVFLSY